MLVVVGIIILVTGMLLPALMRARRSARVAACASNLRQIGQALITYADANQDYTPLGITSFLVKDVGPGADGMATEFTTLTNEQWSCYPIADGNYSAGLGPLVASGFVSGLGFKMFYCPNDADEHLTWNRFATMFPDKSQPPRPHTTVRTSYFGRPVNRQFVHTQFASPNAEMFWPQLLTRLTDVQRKATFAERLHQPYSHGTATAPAANVLYGDGSVRLQQIPKSAIEIAPVDSKGTPIYVSNTLDSLPPSGTQKVASGPPIKNVGSDDVLDSVWKLFDAMN